MKFLKELHTMIAESDDFYDPSLEDPAVLPSHIIKEILKDAKKLMASKKFTEFNSAVEYALRVADIPGLEGEDDLLRAVENILKTTK